MKKNIANILAKNLRFENSATPSQKRELGQIVEQLTQELTVNEALESLDKESLTLLQSLLDKNASYSEIRELIIKNCPGIQDRVLKRLQKILRNA